VDRVIIATALAGVSYPAQRWQLLAQADHYGVGGHIRADLGRLPGRAYPSLEAVIATLTAIAASRPVAEPG
jgi:hypothetical protein